MIVLNRSHITANYTDNTAEAWFTADVSDGKCYEVRVGVSYGGQRGANYAQGLLLGIWNRITDYGWEGGITRPTPEMWLNVTEVKQNATR